eukprot:CAMPEP_0175130052 /NCGR_PEP_ID=MMETSP0087-20121206/5801_1 /TAXON_ID=136419 /ORGANISM="Unknown Unknown, Strain D1" /LENGTH=240 /DNA_ID=CAMNT_0016412245 /DNA_START=179 /DNA_END=901 /DNA_ORIENTATION=-
MDSWSQEQLDSMKKHASTQQANACELEFHVPADFKKPTKHSTREVREKYIRAKYVAPLFGKVDRNGESREARAADVDDAKPVAEGGAAAASIGEKLFIGVVTITRISAAGVVAADLNGFSDPYAVFTLGTQTLKTSVVKKTLNPEWKDTVVLSWNGTDQLQCDVYDWDAMSADDFLGGASISLQDRNLGKPEQVITEPLLNEKHHAKRRALKNMFRSKKEDYKTKPHGHLTFTASLDTFA